jgi:predicted alpha/beta-hydrolase family hydrolase
MHLQFLEKVINMNIVMIRSRLNNQEAHKPAVEEKRVAMPVRKGEDTSGVLTLPGEGKKRTAVIVAHGAGNDMNAPLITFFSRGLVAAGFPVLRFNFLYTEHGRKAPDRQELLVETWKSVYRFAQDALDGVVDSWIAAGKSMGGRVASQMVADNILPVHGLVFLGYPLHPVNNKDRLRDAHLYMIRIPMLFFAGTRDQLCNMEKLDTVLKSLKAPWDLVTVEGGDHSFHVPKSTGTREEEIYEQITVRTVEWLGKTFP